MGERRYWIWGLGVLSLLGVGGLGLAMAQDEDAAEGTCEGCGTDRSSWETARDRAVAACDADCDGTCSRSTSASDNCRFDSGINGYRCFSTCDSEEGEAGSMAISRRADLSGPEQLAEAERVQHEASELSERVLGMLDEARRDGDIVRVTCLDDKLTQINAHLRTMGDRIESLSEAMDTGDDARRNHEFTVITVLSQNFAQLERNANECIGASLYETGATRIVTEIDPRTPDEDASTTPGIPPVDVPAIPPPASI